LLVSRRGLVDAVEYLLHLGFSLHAALLDDLSHLFVSRLDELLDWLVGELLFEVLQNLCGVWNGRGTSGRV
jgi:hypothetical protein